MSTLTGQQVNPLPPINIFDQYAREPQSTGASFLNSMMQSVMQQGPGYSQLMGLPMYGGQLSPTWDQNINSRVYDQWNPQGNAGAGYMQNFLMGPQAGQMAPQWQEAANNMQQYGTIGGYPGQLVHNMAQYGGTGGPGNQALANMLQFGTPSEAGKNVVDMSNRGVAGSWGAPLMAFATGAGNNPAMQYIAPFLNAKPYSSGWGSQGKQGGK